MNENLMQLISKTITVWNILDTLSAKWNITYAWSVWGDTVLNFYQKDYSRWMKQIIININSNVSELEDYQINTLNELLK